MGRMTPLPPSKRTRQQAYEILGVNPNAVANSPTITPYLKEIGGRASAVQYLRMSTHPIARRFLLCYDDMLLPGFVRGVLPIEAFCIKSGVSPDQLLFVLSQSVRDMQQFKASTIAAEKHPAIVAKSSELAAAGDLDHAVLNMKHMGFLPLPKGSQVSVNVNASANAQAQSQSATVLAPSPENTIRGLVNRFNLTPKTQQMLPEAKETVPLVTSRDNHEPMTIESDYESEEDSSTAQDMSNDE